MCGLVGIAGNLEYKDEATMKRLLLLDFLRGPDSTGLASIRKNGEAKIAKLPSHPLDLFEHGKFKEALSATSSHAFIGHNRAATRGVVSTLNAHPYQYGHIVGAHNGTLEAESVRELEKALGEHYPVDSMAIFAAIERFGIEETIKMMREGKDQATGAWALVWYDLADGTLNFLRNKHRPFWYAWSKDGDKIIWASEYPMIQAAVELSSGTYELYTESSKDETKAYKFFGTVEDMHYKIDVGAMRLSKNGPPKLKLKLLKGKEPTPVLAAEGYSPFIESRQTTERSATARGTTKGTSTTPSTSKSHTPDTPSKKDHFHRLGSPTKPLAGFITEERFDLLAQQGCNWCGKTVDFDEPGVLVYDRDSVLLCSSCNDHTWDPVGTPVSRIVVPSVIFDCMS